MVQRKRQGRSLEDLGLWHVGTGRKEERVFGSSEGGRLFRPQSREWELQLLQGDDKSLTKAMRYLRPLIIQVLNRSVIAPAVYRRLEAELFADVRVAARRFLGNPKNLTASYKFSTYFTWYIAQRIEAWGLKKRKAAHRNQSCTPRSQKGGRATS